MTRNAAVQETLKVSAKYETAGCWQIKEDFAAEVDGESMVNEGCYSSRPRGTMSEFLERCGRREARATARDAALFHTGIQRASISGIRVSF